MKRWDETEPALMLFTPEEFAKLPNGTKLEAIDGEIVTKGIDRIDNDTRFGCMAYGSRELAVQELVK